MDARGRRRDLPARISTSRISPTAAVATSSGLQENVAAALCYALGFITGILFLVLEPYNKNRNIRFHAFQSIFLSVFFAIVHYAIFFIGMASWGASISPLPSDQPGVFHPVAVHDVQGLQQ